MLGHKHSWMMDSDQVPRFEVSIKGTPRIEPKVPNPIAGSPEKGLQAPQVLARTSLLYAGKWIKTQGLHGDCEEITGAPFTDLKRQYCQAPM